jgi:hypothetical protein
MRTVSPRLSLAAQFWGEWSAMRSSRSITIHGPKELDASLTRAWHRATDESPEYANPFPLLRACGLSLCEFDPLLEGQKPFAAHVTGTFASPVVDLRPGDDADYPQWLRTTYPGLARTTLKKERRLGRDHGEVRFAHDERDPRMLRRLLAWKSAQYRRTGRMDRFARPWIIDLVDDLFQQREEHFTGVLSVLYAGDRPVAAHFGPRSRTVFAAWFTAYDPELRPYSPGLLMHARLRAH